MAVDNPSGSTKKQHSIQNGGDTLANVIRRKLADSILNGEIEYGTRLDEQTIADQFGVSRTPVREGIAQLSATGLVEIRPRRGTIVVPIDLDFLGLLYETAAHIGAVCAHFAATRMTLTERSDLKGVFLDCKAACDIDDNEAFAKHHRLFHNTIRDGAHNPPLGEALQQSRRRIAPFTKATFKAMVNMHVTLEDQQKILDAIIEQDGNRASSLMRNHINRVGIQVVNNLQQKGILKS